MCASAVVAVGHDKDPLAEMRGADVGCSDTVPFRIEPERGQVSEYVSKEPPVID